MLKGWILVMLLKISVMIWANKLIAILLIVADFDYVEEFDMAGKNKKNGIKRKKGKVYTFFHINQTTSYLDIK